MGFRSAVGEALSMTGRFLLFQPVHLDLPRLRWHYFALGGIGCQLAGMGRYWDAPQAHWWQYAGLGSVAYALFMAAFLWALVMPMRPENWSYLNVLTFVGLTAPPALLYAIPVEALLEPVHAYQLNNLLLLVVSVWRVGLLWRYLRRSARLDVLPAFFAMAFPLVLILAFLTLRQLQQNIFYGMSGNRERLAHDTPDIARLIVSKLGFISVLLFPPVLTGYVVCSAQILDRKLKEAKLATMQESRAEADPIPRNDGAE